MKRRTQITTLLGLGSALVMGGVAHAQGYPGSSSGSYPSGGSSGSYPSSGSSSYPSGGSSGSGGASDASSVNSSTTTTTTTTAPAISDTPPNTGGEPLLMSLFGSLTAGSALFLRRKIR